MPDLLLPGGLDDDLRARRLEVLRLRTAPWRMALALGRVVVRAAEIDAHAPFAEDKNR